MSMTGKIVPAICALAAHQSILMAGKTTGKWGGEIEKVWRTPSHLSPPARTSLSLLPCHFPQFQPLRLRTRLCAAYPVLIAGLSTHSSSLPPLWWWPQQNPLFTSSPATPPHSLPSPTRLTYLSAPAGCTCPTAATVLLLHAVRHWLAGGTRAEAPLRGVGWVGSPPMETEHGR